MSFKLNAVLLAGIVSISAVAFSQNGATSKPAATAAVSQPDKPAAKVSTKEKPLGFTWGWDTRIRSDNQNNNGDFTNQVNDEDRRMRYTHHIFANVDLGKGMHFYVKEGADWYKKSYVTCNSTTAACAGTGAVNAGKSISTPFTSQDIWTDNAYLKFDKLPGLKNTTLQVGRFNLTKGEGFFLWAGIPGAGPKASYFDGILATSKIGKQTIDWLYTYNTRDDTFFPVINKNYTANPTVSAGPAPAYGNDMGDLAAGIVYYSNRQLTNTDFDLYLGQFKQSDMQAVGYNTKFAAADYRKGYSSLQWQPDRHWTALGGRLVERLPQHIIIHGNYTGQFGTQNAMSATKNNIYFPTTGLVNGVANTAIGGYPEVDIRAFAFDASINKYFKVKMKPYVGFMYAYFSGSDPKNPKVDGNYYPAFGEFATSQHPGPFMEEGYPVQSPVADVDGTSSQKEIGIAPYYTSNYISYSFRGGFTAWESKNKKRSITLLEEFKYINAPHPFMGNSAHYNQNPSATATPVQLLTPVIGTAPAFFNNTTLSGLHRENVYVTELNFKMSDVMNFFIYWDHANYGDFYKNTWTATPYSGGTAVTARKAAGNFVRINWNYRFQSFTPYKKNK